MSQAVPIAKNLEDLRYHLMGKKVAALHVYGINSLKTVDPPLVELADEEVVDVIASEQERQLDVVLVHHTVAIDLARTGSAVPVLAAAPWALSDGTVMPTARFIFRDGTGVDLREPAKTKRVTVTIRRN
jgi:hypothetical protein